MRNALRILPVILASLQAQAPVDGFQAGPIAFAAPTANDPVQAQRTFADIARTAWQSVVTVRSYVRCSDPESTAVATTQPGWAISEVSEYPGFDLIAAGSGFVVDPSGDVLTCTHVLQTPDGPLVDLVEIELEDGARVICEIVGVEPTVNVAILHTMVFPNGHPTTLPALTFADSDQMESGQWTLGFGDPAGPEKFMAVGTFIALPRRDCYQDLLSAFFLQTAMVAHPQAYGGPLLNTDGQVIGVLAPRSPTPGGNPLQPHTGIEFALPSKIIAGLYDSIRQTRSFKSPWLGVAVMSRPELAAQRGIEAYQALAKPKTGILIENVWQGGPAAAAGVLPQDWLVGFGDQRIFSPVDFQHCLYLAGIGSEVELEFHRGDATFKTRLTIEERPKSAVPR